MKERLCDYLNFDYCVCDPCNNNIPIKFHICTIPNLPNQHLHSSYRCMTMWSIEIGCHRLLYIEVYKYNICLYIGRYGYIILETYLYFISQLFQKIRKAFSLIHLRKYTNWYLNLWMLSSRMGPYFPLYKWYRVFPIELIIQTTNLMHWHISSCRLMILKYIKICMWMERRIQANESSNRDFPMEITPGHI